MTYEYSNLSSGQSSNIVSRRASFSGGIKQNSSRPKHNVKFSVGSEDLRADSEPKRHSLPELTLTETSDIGDQSISPQPTGNLLDWTIRKDAAALSAHDRANKHAYRVKRNNSLPVSQQSSVDDNSSTLFSAHSPFASPPHTQPKESHPPPESVPLDNFAHHPGARVYDLPGDNTDEDTEIEEEKTERSSKKQKTTGGKHFDEAKRLVRTFTTGFGHLAPTTHKAANKSGSATPLYDQRSYEYDYDYIPAPDQYKPSVLSMLLASQISSSQHQNARTVEYAQQQQKDYLAAKLAPYQDPMTDPREQNKDFFSRKKIPGTPGELSGTQSPLETSGTSTGSGRLTPKYKRPKWYKEERSFSDTGSQGQLLESASVAGITSIPNGYNQQKRPSIAKVLAHDKFENAVDLIKHPVDHFRSASNSRRTSTTDFTIQIQTVHIAERLANQKYLLKMCRALMNLGAPTHRLEQYMEMAARKLLIAASFQYLPGCMIVSFDDPTTHTTELHLVKEATQVDLGKLKDIQEVYKDVIHQKYSIEDAMQDIDDIRNKPKKFGTLCLIFLYGIAAVSVGPFAFDARPIDFPIAFILGCALGSLQLIWASRSSQFSHIFEVAGTFVTSFAARGFGSILYNKLDANSEIFCFSALSQSSIALILPGWIILSAALELQSRNLIAGSIRMVYAIIYTLFLGFGTLLGTTIMGLIYPDATNSITCTMPPYWTASSADGTLWRLIYTKFIWVPIFTLCLSCINQAKWKQIPAQLVISVAGYQVNYWSGQRFSQNIQVANALGAFAIGALANLYSRLGHGVAAAAMLPGIFVMVPSGLAASGSLVAGLTSANQITHNATGTSIVSTGTQGFYNAQNASTAATQAMDNVYGGTIFNVGYGMVQVAIGISVGLFLSALVIYPFGKKRSGLFSF